MTHKLKTRYKIFFVFFLLLIFFGLVAREIWVFPKSIADMPNADYVIVLGATSFGPRPSPVFRERIQEGIRLYREGKAKKLIFTGKPGDPPQAIVAKNHALAQQIPEEDLLIEVSSTNTLENLYFAKGVAKQPEEASFLIVSDPLHLKRALQIAQDLEMNAHPAPTQSTRFNTPVSRLKFFGREVLAYSYYRLQKLFNLHQKKIKNLPHSP